MRLIIILRTVYFRFEDKNKNIVTIRLIGLRKSNNRHKINKSTWFDFVHRECFGSINMKIEHTPNWPLRCFFNTLYICEHCESVPVSMGRGPSAIRQRDCAFCQTRSKPVSRIRSNPESKKVEYAIGGKINPFIGLFIRLFLMIDEGYSYACFLWFSIRSGQCINAVT